jgi:hypothetical protein
MEDLFDVAVFGELDYNLVEDAILDNLLEVRQNAFLRSTKYGRLKNLNTFTEEECISNFRFKHEHLERHVHALGIPPEIRSAHRHTVSGMLIFSLF